MQEINHKDISITYDGTVLTIKNSLIRRTISLEKNFPQTLSLVNEKSAALIAVNNPQGDFSVTGYNTPWYEPAKTEYTVSDIDMRICKADEFDNERVEIDINFSENIQ
ncbi:MAG: hypothetical protein ACYTFY_18420, partial [Planctomycetota bacterium]